MSAADQVAGQTLAILYWASPNAKQGFRCAPLLRPTAVDVTFTRLVDSLDATFAGWANATG